MCFMCLYAGTVVFFAAVHICVVMFRVFVAWRKICAYTISETVIQ